jgi:8-oxo-dGTP diphosphatase
MPHTPILATLGSILSPDGTRVLMVHRTARADDQQHGKYNGLGGKLEPPTVNAEGSLSWVPLARLDDLPMWEVDRHFLPLVFDDDPRPFHGVMPYAEGRPVSWSMSR